LDQEVAVNGPKTAAGGQIRAGHLMAISACTCRTVLKRNYALNMMTLQSQIHMTAGILTAASGTMTNAGNHGRESINQLQISPDDQPEETDLVNAAIF